MTSDGGSTREIKSRIARGKVAFNKESILFTYHLDLNLGKKLVKCYIWSTALCGAETWTLQKICRKAWKVLNCAGEGWRRSVGPIV
jgi:hypothetical protein